MQCGSLGHWRKLCAVQSSPLLNLTTFPTHILTRLRFWQKDKRVNRTGSRGDSCLGTPRGSHFCAGPIFVHQAIIKLAHGRVPSGMYSSIYMWTNKEKLTKVVTEIFIVVVLWGSTTRLHCRKIRKRQFLFQKIPGVLNGRERIQGSFLRGVA